MSRIVFDAIVRHQLYIEGLKAGRAQVLQTSFRKAVEELRKTLALERFGELGNLTKARLRELVRLIREAMRGVFDPYVADTIQWLEFYMREDRSLLGAIYKPYGDVELFPTSERIWSLATNQPMGANGVLPLAFLRTFGLNVPTQIERSVLQVAANNGTVENLIASVIGTRAANNRDGVLNRLFKQGVAVNNTVIQHIAAQTNFNTSKAIFDEYEWISILDDVTTRICRSRDGLRWRYGAGPIPPAHVGCRSNISPVIDGQAVPPLNWSQWSSEQPEALIRDLFGTSTAPSSFTSPRALTLEEFKAKRSLILS